MNQPPGGYGPPPGGHSPQGPYRIQEAPPPPPAPGRWVVPALVVAGPGNLVWLVGFSLNLNAFRSSPSSAMVWFAAALVPHVIFTALFTYALSSARPGWSRGKRIAAGSYLTSGLGGTLALVLGVLAAGLLAAACGGSKR